MYLAPWSPVGERTPIDLNEWTDELQPLEVRGWDNETSMRSLFFLRYIRPKDRPGPCRTLSANPWVDCVVEVWLHDAPLGREMPVPTVAYEGYRLGIRTIIYTTARSPSGEDALQMMARPEAR